MLKGPQGFLISLLKPEQHLQQSKNTHFKTEKQKWKHNKLEI